MPTVNEEGLAISASKSGPMKELPGHPGPGLRDRRDLQIDSTGASREQRKGLTERGPCSSASPLLSCASPGIPLLLHPAAKAPQTE